MTGSCMMAKRRTDGAFASNDLPLGASANRPVLDLNDAGERRAGFTVRL